jgi:hypothetical protein
LEVLSRKSEAHEQSFCVYLPKDRPLRLHLRLSRDANSQNTNDQNTNTQDNPDERFPKGHLLSRPLLLFDENQGGQRVFWVAKRTDTTVAQGANIELQIGTNSDSGLQAGFAGSVAPEMLKSEPELIYSRPAPSRDCFLRVDFAGRNSAPWITWPLLPVVDPGQGHPLTAPSIVERKQALKNLSMFASTQPNSQPSTQLNDLARPQIIGGGFIGTTLNAGADSADNFLEIAAAIQPGAGGPVKQVIAFLGETPLFELEDTDDDSLDLVAGDNLWYRHIPLAGRELPAGMYLVTLRAYDASGGVSELWPGIVVGELPQEERVFDSPPFDENCRVLADRIAEPINLPGEEEHSPLPYIIAALTGGMLLLSLKRPREKTPD